jgi:SAM-dependent methyltransferase
MTFRSGMIRQIVRPWLARLPAPIRGRLRAEQHRFPTLARLLVPAAQRERPPGTVKWGDLRRAAPFSRDWGYDRGTPIDRVYIETFLASHAEDVRGACLEVMNADYTVRFGGTRVTRADVLDIDPANTNATIVADLGEVDSLPARQFDCIIFTQTLHLIPDMPRAMANIWRTTAPGGVLLLTVPALGRHDTRKGFHHDRWRVTRTGLDLLLSELPGARANTMTYGSLVSCTAFLYGLAAEELSADELGFVDGQFPLIVAARVHKEETP